MRPESLHSWCDDNRSVQLQKKDSADHEVTTLVEHQLVLLVPLQYQTEETGTPCRCEL